MKTNLRLQLLIGALLLLCGMGLAQLFSREPALAQPPAPRWRECFPRPHGVTMVL
jgi:hypothetical protein